MDHRRAPGSPSKERGQQARNTSEDYRVDRIERGLKKIQLVSGASAGCPGAHSEDLLNLGAIQVRGVETDRPFPLIDAEPRGHRCSGAHSLC